MQFHQLPVYLMISRHGSVVCGSTAVSYPHLDVYKRQGSCASCPSAQSTIEEVVKGIVMENVQGVKDVVLDTSVSEDLLDMARMILRKEKH